MTIVTMQSMWKTYLRYFSWLISLAAMGYLVYQLATYDHYDQIRLSLHDANGYQWVGILSAILLIPAQLLAETRRWQWVLEGWKNISFIDSWRQVMAGMLAGFITPYRAGDVPARLAEDSLSSSSDQYALSSDSSWKDQFQHWLKDWHKWGWVLVWTVIRYAVWGVQLWGVLTFVGIYLSPWQAVSSIALYYVVISLMPGLPAADVAIKGGWAAMIFGQFTTNVVAITIAVSIIWLLNTILPVIWAEIEKITRR